MTRFDHLIDYEKIKPRLRCFQDYRKRGRWILDSLIHITYMAFDCESTVWFRWCFDKVEKLDKSYY